MNYLAHLFLSHGEPPILMGNFLGDLIRSSEYKALPSDIQRGVDLHRKIDRFTDTHPQVKQAVQILQPYHQKYASVVVDVFYDYLLLNNWEKYTHQELHDFTMEAYQIIEQYKEWVPLRYQNKVENMLRHNWLLSYGEWDSLHQTFLRLKQRAKFPGQFELATQHLQNHLDELDSNFQLFFPDILGWTKEFVIEEACLS